MTLEEAELVVDLMRARGVQAFTLDGLAVTFWQPLDAVKAGPSRAELDVSDILNAPITEEELYGYTAPEHLQDPDDPEHLPKHGAKPR